MSRASRSKRSRTPERRAVRRPGAVQIALRLLLTAVVCGVLGIAAALVLRTTSQRGAQTTLPVTLPASSTLNPLEAAALGAQLALNQRMLETPLDPQAAPVTFTVSPGESAAVIADHLHQQGLIADARLFRSYLRYTGLDVQMEAGTYQLSAAMTIPEIALLLTDAAAPEITIRVTEGWRREQIAEWIDRQPDVPFTGAEFLAATASAGAAPVFSLSAEIPPGQSLEGFLFPDTYRVPLDASAGDLVQRMLENFDARVTPQMRADAAARGWTFYQVITIASIVEREAVVPEERPRIASVYLNRLANGIRLEADPTVQYAMGYQPASGEWWNRGLTQADYYAVDSPYNTYLYGGLPPGPIASPGLDSIRAVLYPEQTPYFFFRATCDGSGRHNFAITFEEHLANACP